MTVSHSLQYCRRPALLPLTVANLRLAIILIFAGLMTGKRHLIHILLAFFWSFVRLNLFLMSVCFFVNLPQRILPIFPIKTLNIFPIDFQELFIWDIDSLSNILQIIFQFAFYLSTFYGVYIYTEVSFFK